MFQITINILFPSGRVGVFKYASDVLPQNGKEYSATFSDANKRTVYFTPYFRRTGGNYATIFANARKGKETNAKKEEARG